MNQFVENIINMTMTRQINSLLFFQKKFCLMAGVNVCSNKNDMFSSAMVNGHIPIHIYITIQ